MEHIFGYMQAEVPRKKCLYLGLNTNFSIRHLIAKTAKPVVVLLLLRNVAMRLRRAIWLIYIVVPTLLAAYHLPSSGGNGSRSCSFNEAECACCGHQFIRRLRQTSPDLRHVSYVHCISDEKLWRMESCSQCSLHPDLPFINKTQIQHGEADYLATAETAHFHREASVQIVKRVETDDIVSFLG